METKTACVLLAAFALSAGPTLAQDPLISKPPSPTTQDNPTVPPGQTANPPPDNPIAPERSAPDKTIRHGSTSAAKSAAEASKDTSTEAPGGQAESSRNGALSTSPPAEPRPPLAPEPRPQPDSKEEGPPN
jgi:hypothetical protein